MLPEDDPMRLNHVAETLNIHSSSLQPIERIYEVCLYVTDVVLQAGQTDMMQAVKRKVYG
jgi:hypothetical protein